MTDARKPLALAERLAAERGALYLTGTQALVLLPLLQARVDARRGVATGGYVTGYRGSPLGGYDQQLWRARPLLDRAGIVFQPGLNEDLAATAVWGTQQAALRGEGKVEGVYSIWYGKGPGVDRSGDALRHGNLAGSARDGGVLVLMGDDHTCESSTTAHQSEYALVDAMIPILNPAGLQELVEFGLVGFALSRQSGCWVGLKCVKDTVDVTGIVEVPEALVERLAAVPPPQHDLNIRLTDSPLAQEERLHTRKLAAAQAFARGQGLDRIVAKTAGARIGIVSAGKSYLDTISALDAAGLRRHGELAGNVALLKLGMVWPVDPEIVRRFADGLDLLLVIEEKRPLIEAQVKDVLFNARTPTRVIGKASLEGAALLPSHGALSRAHLLHAFATAGLVPGLPPEGGVPLKGTAVSLLDRKPYFCAGCPHNASTVLPEGSRAYAGIGCSYMAQWMDRSTLGFTQMGGEGANWIGEFPFSKRGHVFQNMGDGTYLHSGMLAVRAAVAANAPMTFKILFNDAVAMTGGQRHDGTLTPGAIAAQLLAEGAKRVVITSDDPARTRSGSRIPPEVDVVARDRIDGVQRELREVPGVTALIHDQVCAAEKRRRRKRGTMPQAPKRALIHKGVCEGCGDCGLQSNCVAVQPVRTPLGSKREIDQSACNADLSCVKGFCPSFVTVEPAAQGVPRAAAKRAPAWTSAELPEPPRATLPCAVLVSGVGGTGIVTVSAIVGMAAYLEGLHFTSLDMAGLAQKGGEVAAHLRIAAGAAQLASPRLDAHDATAFIAGDLVVAASARLLEKVRPGTTRMVVNDFEIPTGDFVRNPDLEFPRRGLQERLRAAAGDRCDFVDAVTLAREELGDAIATNMILLGFAFQRGLLPVAAASIEAAIRENGTAAEANLAAFRLGRVAAHAPEAIGAREAQQAAEPLPEETFAHHLEAYQGPAYAARYRERVARVARREAESTGSRGAVTDTVARNLGRLMGYKDEYEVARLLASSDFAREVEAGFGTGARLTYHLAPPMLAFLRDAAGRPRKLAFGAWLRGPMALLARLKFLRGTPLDPFGYTTERRRERAAIATYERRVDAALASLGTGNRDQVARALAYADQIRGFGPVKEASFGRAEKAWAEATEGLGLTRA